MKMLPIGVSNFRELIEYKDPSDNGYFYVDKSMFIKELLYDGSKVIVLPRPRRFGKTLNMSMLEHFFSKECGGKPTAHLFENLEISKHPECMKYQGKYPVIFITFKELKKDNYDECLDGFKSIIATVFDKHGYLLQEDLSDLERDTFKKTLQKSASKNDFEQSLLFLSSLISRYKGVKPYILIDEYDIPIQQAYIKGYYEEVVSFIRALFSAALKDNDHITKAVLTGIVRVSKESLFSGLNNIIVHSIFSDSYSKCFGFLEEEVEEALSVYNISNNKDSIKSWYNGYIFGDDNTIYNPWSILNCLKNRGQLQSYWINTSGNDLIKKQIENASPNLSQKIQLLMQGEVINESINEHLVFQDLDKNQDSVWSLLVLTGYLKVVSAEPDASRYSCKLAIPNKEIAAFYRDTIVDWMSKDLGLDWFKDLLTSLRQGNVNEFKIRLNKYILESASYLDTSKDNQESFYHGLMLGLVAGLKNDYIIKSNRESGLGRYDVALIPSDKSALGIIMEFKKTKDSEDLADVAKQALEQAIKLSYRTELEQVGVSNIIVLGMAFNGKEVEICK